MLHRTLLPVSAPPSGRRLGRSRTTEIGDRCRHEFKVYNRGDPPVPPPPGRRGDMPASGRHRTTAASSRHMPPPTRPNIRLPRPPLTSGPVARFLYRQQFAESGHTPYRTDRPYDVSDGPERLFPFGQCSSPITASKKRCRHAKTHDRDKRFAPAEPLSRTWLNIQLPGRKIFTSGRSDRTFFRYLRVPSQS